MGPGGWGGAFLNCCKKTTASLQKVGVRLDHQGPRSPNPAFFARQFFWVAIDRSAQEQTASVHSAALA